MSVGAVDIGTNSMRLLILDDTGGVIERSTEITGLGTGLDASGRLGDEAIGRTLAVLDGFGDRLRTCDGVRVVATSASREAENGPEFIDRATAALGHRPELISGEQEARLAYRGAIDALEPAEGSVPVVVDIGGGSTEFVEPDNEVSCRIGSVRLTDRLLSERPVPFDRLETAAAAVSDAITVHPVENGNYWMVGVAGTWTSLAGLVRGRYVPGEVHGTVLTRLDVDRLVVRLAALSFAETERLPGLEPARARVILGGSIIAREALRRFGLPEATISEADLLDALARSLL